METTHADSDLSFRVPGSFVPPTVGDDETELMDRERVQEPRDFARTGLMVGLGVATVLMAGLYALFT